ncbi:MAG: PQQ-binding-like beta-propeller repeat protein [Planctomycetia bacterium]|nr:PQQ-binding-like beta-propeller repeat protein [Planctomycetia bacterium]
MTQPRLTQRIFLTSLIVAAFFVECAVSPVAISATVDWPGYRGPTGDGHAVAENLPHDLNQPANLVWKTPIPGTGWSTPVVLGDQVWMTTATDGGKSLRAICVRTSSGRLVHDIEIFAVEKPAEIHKKNSHASPTPAIETGRLYVHFGTNGTAAIDTATGKIVWRNSDHTLEHMVGPGSSPVLYKDLVVLTCDGADVQYSVGLDTATGKERWKTPRSGVLRDNPDVKKSFATPAIFRVGDQDELVTPAADHVYAYDPATGGELWQLDYDGFSVVPRPVAAHGLVFVCTGFNTPKLLAIKQGGVGKLPPSAIAWEEKSQIPATPALLVVGEELYVMSDRGVATCLDAKSGRELWRHRIGGNFSASPLLADGLIIFASEEGVVTLVEPGKSYREVAVSDLGVQIMASPIAFGSTLIIRTAEDIRLFRKPQ